MNALVDFRRITGFDIQAFFNEYTEFVDSYYTSIVAYYNGADLNGEAFSRLDALNRQLTRIEPLIDIYRDNFPNIDYWEIVDQYSDIYTNIQTINNLGRWLRSSRTTQFDTNIKVDRILRQGETFELVANDIGSINPQNDWTIIAIENLVNEEDYTSGGGVLFQLTLRDDFTVGLPNIVDFSTGLNLYGKDIDKRILFEDNDLKVVTERDALIQTLNTILSTRRGSIPEFPNDGIADQLIGSNVNAFQYPIMLRNIINLFNRDPRFTQINVLDLFRRQDAIFMRLEVVTILRDNLITNLAI